MISKKYYKKIKKIDNNKEIRKNIMIKKNIIIKQKIMIEIKIGKKIEGRDRGLKIERININTRISMIYIEIE